MFLVGKRVKSFEAPRSKHGDPNFSGSTLVKPQGDGHRAPSLGIAAEGNEARLCTCRTSGRLAKGTSRDTTVEYPRAAFEIKHCE